MFTMIKSLAVLGIAAVTAFAAAPAKADHVSVGLGINIAPARAYYARPVYVAPAPVTYYAAPAYTTTYVAPAYTTTYVAPAYVAPAPVVYAAPAYVAPAPVYVAPAPVYYSRPVFDIGIGFGFGGHWGGGHGGGHGGRR
jgi:hypothetical protein